MAQHDTISKEVLRRYKEDCKALNVTPGYIYVQYGPETYQSEMSLSTLRDCVFKARKHKMKRFHPVSVDPVQSDQISSFCTGIGLSKERKNPFTYSDMTGMFKMNFSDGSFMYVAKWLNGAGRNQKFENLFAGEKDTWIKFLQFVKQTKRHKLKPKNGIFKIDVVMINGIPDVVYYELKDLAETPIIHPETEKVNGDIDFFFKNLPMFTRFKMPGTRKAMLVGEPGSGKSSYCIKLAKKFAATKSIVFATKIEALAMHMRKCAKYKVSTIGILEDAEQSVSGASSGLLNFLDGIDQPTNKQGCYIVMTTNYPGAIEPRILQRPGRIDKIFNFNALENNYAVKCLEIYLKDYLETKAEKEILSPKNSEKLVEIVSGMTGAQIKSLVDATISYVVSNTAKLNIDALAITKEQMFKDLKDVYKLAKITSIKGKEKSVGFNTKVEQKNDLQLVPISDDELF